MLEPTTKKPYLVGYDDERRSAETRKNMIKTLLRGTLKHISKQDLIDIWNEAVIESIMEQ